jgi:hypothetical protein
MDTAEAHVLKHFTARGMGPVEHEPDGNVPPDFLVEQRIAVEVRRLIQHEKGSDKARGLSEVAIPLRHKVRKLLAEAGPRVGDISWFVVLKYKRPVPDWSRLRPMIAEWLCGMRLAPGQASLTRDFGGRFELRLFQASKGHDQHFILGLISDWDSGGMVLSEMKRNLEICIAEKTAKIAPYRQKYPEWWLVVTDHIGLGQDPNDLVEFRKLIARPAAWDRVVIVDAGDPAVYFEF